MTKKANKSLIKTKEEFQIHISIPVQANTLRDTIEDAMEDGELGSGPIDFRLAA